MPGQRYAVTRSVFEPRANTSRPSTEAQSTPAPKDFSINIRLHTVLSDPACMRRQQGVGLSYFDTDSGKAALVAAGHRAGSRYVWISSACAPS
jgi:hypothetical protein